jgi:hypothetical protein
MADIEALTEEKWIGPLSVGLCGDGSITLIYHNQSEAWGHRKYAPESAVAKHWRAILLAEAV